MPQSRINLGVNDANSWRCADSAARRQQDDWPDAARWLREKVGLAWIPEDDLIRAAGINDINAIFLCPLNGNDAKVRAGVVCTASRTTLRLS